MICQNCGCVIENGGHKSNFKNGWSASGYVCDNCVDEDRANAKAAFTLGKWFAKLMIGVFGGIGMALGVAYAMVRGVEAMGIDMDNASKTTCLIPIFAIEGIALFVWIACKIFGRRLNVAILRFFCNIISFFLFWFVLVWGLVSYLLLKAN